MVKQQALKRNLEWGYIDGHFTIIDTNIEVYKCEELFLFTFKKNSISFFGKETKGVSYGIKELGNTIRPNCNFYICEIASTQENEH